MSNEQTILRPGTVFIGTLPASDKPWRFTTLADPLRLIATNPDHEPIVMELFKPMFVILDNGSKKAVSPWATST